MRKSQDCCIPDHITTSEKGTTNLVFRPQQVKVLGTKSENFGFFRSFRNEIRKLFAIFAATNQSKSDDENDKPTGLFGQADSVQRQATDKSCDRNTSLRKVHPDGNLPRMA